MGFIVLILSFLAMEFVAWFSHKYIMHGFLWKWHKDHHVVNPKKKLQKNDYFFLVFATPGIVTIIIGTLGYSWIYFFIGLGITLYGCTYFIIHDIYIHRRMKWFRKSKNTYLNTITRCHKLHHKNPRKEGGSYFGLLWIPIKYYRENGFLNN